MGTIINSHILYWLKRNKMYDRLDTFYDELIATAELPETQDELKFGRALYYLYEVNQIENGVYYLQQLANSNQQIAVSNKPAPSTAL